MYKRYVDDSAEGMEALKPGVRLSEEEQRMIPHPRLVEEDLQLEPDLRSMREVVKMGIGQQHLRYGPADRRLSH